MTDKRCQARMPKQFPKDEPQPAVPGGQCGDYEGHGGDHTLLIPTNAPWFNAKLSDTKLGMSGHLEMTPTESPSPLTARVTARLTTELLGEVFHHLSAVYYAPSKARAAILAAIQPELDEQERATQLFAQQLAATPVVKQVPRWPIRRRRDGRHHDPTDRTQ